VSYSWARRRGVPALTEGEWPAASAAGHFAYPIRE